MLFSLFSPLILNLDKCADIPPGSLPPYKKKSDDSLKTTQLRAVPHSMFYVKQCGVLPQTSWAVGNQSINLSSQLWSVCRQQMLLNTSIGHGAQILSSAQHHTNQHTQPCEKDVCVQG